MPGPDRDLDPAPFFDDRADAPCGSCAHWVTAADGVRLRIGWFGRGARGTILCFPGRTEYIEKYSQFAKDLVAAGFGVLAIDWRGQGLADSLTNNPMLGHVDRFADYQADVAALTAYAAAQDMPRPWYLLAHSMGGAIGLRALRSGLDVAAVVFSAPMWGLTIPPAMRPLARSLPSLADALGLGRTGVPFNGPQPYVLTASPKDNLLTSDPDMFCWFRDHVRQHPALALGPPTMRWLREAMRECEDFVATPPPALPCHIHLGSDEGIVCPKAVHQMAARWTDARLTLHDGGRHEVLMERPTIRNAVLDSITQVLPH